jgi:ribosomal protein S18 acetylase RimI-like enzyme
LALSNGLGVIIRRARPEEVPETRALLVATWHATYDAIYGAAKVTEITGRWHSESVLASQLNAEDSVFLNAFDHDQLVGTLFAALQPDGAVMLNRLYVRPDVQGRGVGQLLFEAGMDALGDPEIVRLEVEPDNAGAVEFYERLGFEESGAVDDCGGSSGIPAIRMTLERH